MNKRRVDENHVSTTASVDFPDLRKKDQLPRWLLDFSRAGGSIILPEGSEKPDEKAVVKTLPKGKKILFFGFNELDSDRRAYSLSKELQKQNDFTPVTCSDLDNQTHVGVSHVFSIKQPDVVMLPHPSDKSPKAVTLREAVFNEIGERRDVGVIYYPVAENEISNVNLTYSFSNPQIMQEGFHAMPSQTRVAFDDSMIGKCKLRSELLKMNGHSVGRFVHSFNASIIKDGLNTPVSGLRNLDEHNYREAIGTLLGTPFGKGDVCLSASPHADDGLLWAGVLGNQMHKDGICFFDMVLVSGIRGVRDDFVNPDGRNISEGQITRRKLDTRMQELLDSADVMGWGRENTSFLELPMYENKEPPTDEDFQRLDAGIQEVKKKGVIKVVITPPSHDLHPDHVRTNILMKPMIEKIAQDNPILILEADSPWSQNLNSFLITDDVSPKLPESESIIQQSMSYLTPVVSELAYDGPPGTNIDEKKLWTPGYSRPMTEGYLFMDVEKAREYHQQ